MTSHYARWAARFLVAGILLLAGCTSSSEVDQAATEQPAEATETVQAETAATVEPVEDSPDPTSAVATEVPDPASAAAAEESELATAAEPFDLDRMQAMSDFPALTGDEYDAFCAEILKLDSEGPELQAIHDRLGLDGGLYENVQVPCVVLDRAESGAFEINAEDRERAQRSRDDAVSATFDFFDVTYQAPDVGMVTRAYLQGNSREQPYLYFVYKTAHEGGYNSAISRKTIAVHMFDIRNFPDYLLECGPLGTSQPSVRANDKPCEQLQESANGEPIFKGQSLSFTDDYSITLGNTRIIVEAESEAEAFAVLRSVVPIAIEDMDFFSKP